MTSFFFHSSLWGSLVNRIDAINQGALTTPKFLHVGCTSTCHLGKHFSSNNHALLLGSTSKISRKLLQACRHWERTPTLLPERSISSSSVVPEEKNIQRKISHKKTTWAKDTQLWSSSKLLHSQVRATLEGELAMENENGRALFLLLGHANEMINEAITCCKVYSALRNTHTKPKINKGQTNKRQTMALKSTLPAFNGPGWQS